VSKPTEFWRWIVNSESPPGKRIKTRHLMTREQALARDPTAEPVPGSMEMRDLPETEDERGRMHFHSINRKPPKE
jgi:hypothetical protein